MTLLDFDRTASSSSNLISGEIHPVNLTPGSAILTEHGLFYQKDFEVYSLPSNTLLTKGIDYNFVGYSKTITEATAGVGRGVFAGIRLLNQTLTGSISVTYRAVGGREGNPIDIYYQLQSLLSNNPSTVNFFNTIDRPDEYPPSDHSHDISDLDGIGALTYYAKQIADALSNRRVPVATGQNLLNKFNNLTKLFSSTTNQINRIEATVNAFIQSIASTTNQEPFTTNTLTDFIVSTVTNWLTLHPPIPPNGVSTQYSTFPELILAQQNNQLTPQIYIVTEGTFIFANGGLYEIHLNDMWVDSNNEIVHWVNGVGGGEVWTDSNNDVIEWESSDGSPVTWIN